MNKDRRESVAKYLYDMSKGIALLAVVGNMVKDKWDTVNTIVGVLAAIGFFLWGYSLEGGVKKDE